MRDMMDPDLPGEQAGSGAMSDNELASILAQHENNAIGYYNSAIANDQVNALNYYYRRPFGDEMAGRSQVVDGTVAIVVDNALATLLKPFVSSEESVAFEPQGEEDEEAAKQATEYVNFVFSKDNPGFQILHDWFKDALLLKLGVVKVWWEDKSARKPVSLDNLEPMQLEQIIADEGDSVIEGPYQTDTDYGPLFSVVIERDYADGCVKIENVPCDEFKISPFARSVEEADYLAHKPKNITRSDLIAMGFDPEIVDGLSAWADDAHDDPRVDARFQDENWNSSNGPVIGDRSRDRIAVIDEYTFIDFNGDGVSELRRVIRVDTTILLNEEIEFHPFATLCPVPMPHKVIGLSMADQVMDLQRIQSVLWRQMLDNLYLSNNPRPVLPSGSQRTDGSTEDSLADNSPGAAIYEDRVPIRFEAVPFVADKSFPMLQYAEGQQEVRTGVSRAGQGLDTNALKKSGMTATEMAMIEGGKNTRVEMVARIFAETGVKTLFKKILKLVVQHQPRERVIRLRNKWVPVDPRSWNAEMDMTIAVGLGVGNRMEQMAQADAVLETMAELAQTPFASLLDQSKVYNAVKRKFTAAGIKNIDDFLIEPQEGQPQPEPPPSPEAIKAQADMQAQQAKLQLDQQKAQADIQVQREKNSAQIEMEREKAAIQAELAQNKARAEFELALAKMDMEREIAERKMAMEAELAAMKMQAETEIASKKAVLDADAKVQASVASSDDSGLSSYRPGGDLAE